MYICPVCKGKIESPQNFCPRCGFPLYADVANRMAVCKASDTYREEFSLLMKILQRDSENKTIMAENLREMKEELKALRESMELKEDRKREESQTVEKSVKTSMASGTNAETSTSYSEEDLDIKEDFLAKYKGLQSVVYIPGYVKEIGSFAFDECSVVKKVKIPSQLSYIGIRAFSGTGLEEIVIPPGIKEILPWTFYNCKYLKKVTFNEGLKKIQSGAFSGCSALETIYIPDSVIEIGETAFAECLNLYFVSMPKSTVCEKDAFRNTNCKIERR